MEQRLIAMLRVKNEARWIAEVLRSIKPVCESTFVLDDCSDDDTPNICAAEGATVWYSTFVGLDEARDKDWMMQQAKAINPDWILMIDGDEVLTEDSVPVLQEAMRNRDADWYSFRILYLWDRPDQIRTDGVYRNFRRTSMFRFAGRPIGRFMRSGAGGNFHCKNSPGGMLGVGREIDAKLLHYGYMHREDRIRKFCWYNERDPRNHSEDCYRHMVQGDIAEVPANTRLMHAGPLELAPLEVCVPAR